MWVNAASFAAKGHLYIAEKAEEHDELEQHAKAAEAHGITIERIVGPDLRRRWSWLGDGLHAGTFSARDATANPRLVTPAAARAAQRLGVDVVENTEVVDVQSDGRSFAIATNTGLRVSCGALVNAAGAWATAIAERFGEAAPHVRGRPAAVCDGAVALRDRAVRADRERIGDFPAGRAWKRRSWPAIRAPRPTRS